MLRWLQEVVEKIGLMVFSMKGTCDCEEKKYCGAGTRDGLSHSS